MRVDEMTRFWTKVNKTETCWLWTGAANRDGYGTFRPAGSRKMVKAYRFIYEREVGPLGDLEIDHLCRRPACVRLDHLEAVTRQENLRRTRRRTAKCGHPMETYGGKRCCRQCTRAKYNAYQLERRRAAGAVPGGPAGRAALQTTCKHGHDYTPENTGRDRKGGRFCRTCRRIQAAKRRQVTLVK